MKNMIYVTDTIIHDLWELLGDQFDNWNMETDKFPADSSNEFDYRPLSTLEKYGITIEDFYGVEPVEIKFNGKYWEEI